VALIDDFLPALAFAAMLASEDALADTPYETARADMDNLLDQAMEKAREHNPRQAENALFAVCAFADEAILGSGWSGRTEWLGRKLQQVRFNTANAGQEFYERLSGLLSGIPTGPEETPHREEGVRGPDYYLRDALEVYAACLGLGFRGRFHDEQGRARIDRLIKTNLKKLNVDGEQLEDKVFPETYSASTPARKGSRTASAIRALILIGLPALVATGIYLVYSSLLTTFVNRWLQAL